MKSRRRINLTNVIAGVRREIAATTLPEGFFTSLEGTFQAQEIRLNG